LKILYEKNQLNEELQESVNQSELSLKAHLYASKYEVGQLKDRLDKLNFILSSSPYVYCLVDMKLMTFEWLSNNTERLFGYPSRSLRGVKVEDVLLDSEEQLEIKDGFIINQPFKKLDDTLTWVDLYFQMSTKEELTLITFHEVKERFGTTY
jgi:PAS domain-containing protein